jgi:predicted RNase H-like nuclease (RuvC/YqgF family)
MNTVEQQIDYHLGNVLYYVKFGQSKSKGEILFIGTKVECDEKLEEILSYQTDPSLASKITKKLAPKATEQLLDKNRETCKLQLLEAQVSQMESKIKSLELTLSQKETTISILEKRCQSFETTESEKSSEIDSLNKTKLLSIASCIFNNYGSINDVQNLLILNNESEMSSEVALSVNFPDYKIPIRLKNHLLKMIREGKKTTSYVD